jgi:hypothetical protein
MTVSFDDMLACARRELEMRRRVYARRIAGGKMTQALADKETRAMTAIVEHLEGVAAGERLL